MRGTALSSPHLHAGYRRDVAQMKATGEMAMGEGKSEMSLELYTFFCLKYLIADDGEESLFGGVFCA